VVCGGGGGRGGGVLWVGGGVVGWGGCFVRPLGLYRALDDASTNPRQKFNRRRRCLTAGEPQPLAPAFSLYPANCWSSRSSWARHLLRAPPHRPRTGSNRLPPAPEVFWTRTSPTTPDRSRLPCRYSRSTSVAPGTVSNWRWAPPPPPVPYGAVTATRSAKASGALNRLGSIHDSRRPGSPLSERVERLDGRSSGARTRSRCGRSHVHAGARGGVPEDPHCGGGPDARLTAPIEAARGGLGKRVLSSSPTRATLARRPIRPCTSLRSAAQTGPTRSGVLRALRDGLADVERLLFADERWPNVTRRRAMSSACIRVASSDLAPLLPPRGGTDGPKIS